MVRLRNNVHVTGKGPRTLVFAHGFGTDQNAWSAQVAAFQDRFQCVLFDHVGSGNADSAAFSPQRYSSLYSYASDLVEICAALELDRVTVVGHSVSGMISIIASLLKPDLIDRVIAIGASPRYLNDASSGYKGGFEQDDLDALFEAMTSNYQSWVSGFAPLAMGNPDKPELARYFAETLISIRPDIAQAVLRVIFTSDHRSELSRVRVPVHVLQSSRDVAVPDEVGEFLAANIETSNLVKLTSTGHLPHVSAPYTVNEAITDCLGVRCPSNELSKHAVM